MKYFKDRVAVITGAASGIGRGLAERCVKEGMKVVLADIEEPTLLQTQKELQSIGAKVLAIRTDVSKARDVEVLANKTLDTFGAVHLLFNNAGVSTGSTIWESSLADWEWVLGVNLWGVIHGLRVFIPIMLAQDTECYIVNTASIAGLLSLGGIAPYQVSKHAVVALSEHLYHSLVQRNAKVKASVLCPGFVNTRIMDAERNRPIELQNETANTPLSPEDEVLVEYMRQVLQAGMSPQQVANYVFQAIREERFYILTHPEMNTAVQIRMEDILQQRNPSSIF